ncbi:MAG TPA: DUF4238 domain-containing protein [Micropepsaceae bacterium]|nr:DUF4238 domain-containing protein [Micropepsaceae bacterium]
MAKNKDQHYVPEAHFKPFSVQQEGRAIHLCNIAKMIAIPNAAVKGQCSKHYFYGKDNIIEEFLLNLEGAYATIVRNVQNDAASLSPEDAAELRRFIFLQSLRTEASIQRISAAQMSMSSAIFRERQGDEPVPTDHDIVRFAMRAFSEASEVVADLKTCVLINHTKCGFITSDDPAILTNRLHMQRFGDANFGWSNSGAMLFLPLTPRYAFMCYDGLVYTVLDKVNGTVNVHAVNDVETLNEFQALNCSRNLYFSNWGDRASVLGRYDAVRTRRIASRHFIHVCIRDFVGGREIYRPATEEEQSRKGHFLLRSGNVYPVPPRWPSILKFRQKPQTFSNGSGVGHVRKQEWLTSRTDRGW